MAREDVEADFPSLIGKDYDLSDEDFNFNCLAFALGDHSQWWEPPNGGGTYWPEGFPDDITVETVESIIRVHGFTVEIDVSGTPTTPAIAIYAQGNEWTHFARFDNGIWASKLGDGHDILRVTLKDLEGGLYGDVVKVLSRPTDMH